MSEPKVYIIDNTGSYTESSLSILDSIENLEYDFGGANPSLYSTPNTVIVDITPIEQFILSPGEIQTEKIYIQHDLNKFINLPKSSKVIVSHLYYHIFEVDNFCKTLQKALNVNGEIHFKTGRLDAEHYQFFNTLYGDYGFELPFHKFRHLSIWDKKLNKYLNTFYVMKKLERELI